MFNVDLETLSYQDGILKRSLSEQTLNAYLEKMNSTQTLRQELTFEDVSSGVISFSPSTIRALIPPMKVKTPYFDVDVDFVPDYDYEGNYPTKELEFITPTLIFTSELHDTTSGPQLSLGTTALSWVHFISADNQTSSDQARILPAPFPNLFDQRYHHDIRPIDYPLQEGRICWGNSNLSSHLLIPSNINQLVSEFFYNYSNNDLDATFLLFRIAWLSDEGSFNPIIRNLPFEDLDEWAKPLARRLNHYGLVSDLPTSVKNYLQTITPQAFEAYRDLANILEADSLYVLLQEINRIWEHETVYWYEALKPIHFIALLQERRPENTDEFEWAAHIWDILGRIFD